MDEAIKFLIPLQTLSSTRILPHLLAYGIHSRRRKYALPSPTHIYKCVCAKKRLLFVVGKFLLMLQSIKRTQAVDPENGELHSIIVDFMLTCKHKHCVDYILLTDFCTSLYMSFMSTDDAHKEKLPPAVREVIDSSQPILTGEKNVVDLNHDFLRRHQDSLDHMIPGMAQCKSQD